MLDAILHGIEVTNETGMSTAVGLVTDLSNILPEAVSGQLNNFIPPLKHVRSDTQLGLNTKLHTIVAIGNLCLAAEKGILYYLTNIMHTLTAAA